MTTSRPSDLDDLDPAAARRVIQGVLAGLKVTRSRPDKRMRRQLVEAWQHLNRGGDPYALLRAPRLED